MKKRNLSLIAMALVAAISVTNVSAASGSTVGEQKFADQNSQTAGNEIYLTEEDVFEALAYTFQDTTLQTKIASEEQLSPSGVSIQRFDAQSYSEYTDDEYGGMYLDENGQLVICYVNGSETMQAQQAMISQTARSNTPAVLKNEENEVVAQNYTFKSVEYSESELLNAYDLVNDFAEQSGMIQSVDVNVIENRIDIGVQSEADVPQINQALVQIEGMYELALVDPDFGCENCTVLNGTSRVYTPSAQYSSVAGKIYCPRISGYGVVTCGHGWNQGDYVYSTNNTSTLYRIGIIADRRYDGDNDSSLIQLYAGNIYSGSTNEEFGSELPVVGSNLTLRGGVSGQLTAKVTSVNYSATISNVYCKGMIRCDKAIQPGDSGGGAIGKYIDSGRTAVILGINKARFTNGSGTLLIKGKAIIDAYS